MAVLSQEELASLTTMEETPIEQGVSQTPISSKTLSIRHGLVMLRLSISMRRVRTIKDLIKN